MNHWADVAPLQGVDIDDKGEVTVSIAGNSIQFSFVYLLVHKCVKNIYHDYLHLSINLHCAN